MRESVTMESKRRSRRQPAEKTETVVTMGVGIGVRDVGGADGKRHTRRKRQTGKGHGKSGGKVLWWEKVSKMLKRRWQAVNGELWHGVLAQKRVVSVLNLVVLLVLTWQTVSMIRMGGDMEMTERVLEGMSVEELPYPLNIVVQVRRKNITAGKGGSGQRFAGYVRMKRGTFRNQYPSTSVEGGNTFDGVYVVASGKCESLWNRWQKRGNEKRLSYMKWEMADWRDVSLTDGSVGIGRLARIRKEGTGKRGVNMLKRQVTYFEAHRRLWKYMVETGKQRVLVMDDWLFPKERLLKRLPGMLTNMDQESVARQRPWHVMLLRRKNVLGREKERDVWSMERETNARVVIANISSGMGAYVVSLEGARELLERVKEFRWGLDVDIGVVQRESEGEFVALSGCDGVKGLGFCAEDWEDIGSADRGIECAWRRLEEKKSAGELENVLVAK